MLPQAPSRGPDRHPQRATRTRCCAGWRSTGFVADGSCEALQELLLLAPRSNRFPAPLLLDAQPPGSSPLIRTTIDVGLQRRLEDPAAGLARPLAGSQPRRPLWWSKPKNMAVRAYSWAR